MKHMLPAQDRMSPHPPQEIFQRPHPPRNDCGVLFSLARTLDGIVRQRLFGRDGGDDEDGVERLEGRAERVKVRISVVRLAVLYRRQTIAQVGASSEISKDRSYRASAVHPTTRVLPRQNSPQS